MNELISNYEERSSSLIFHVLTDEKVKRKQLNEFWSGIRTFSLELSDFWICDFWKLS